MRVCGWVRMKERVRMRMKMRVKIKARARVQVKVNIKRLIAQVTSSEIACYHWLTRVTCRSVSFSIGPVRITGFVSRFVYKRTAKGNFEKPQKLNEFSKLSTKSCMNRTMNNL